MQVEKLSEKALEVAKNYLETIDSCSVGLLELSRQKKDAQKKLWDLIREEHPSVKETSNTATFNHLTNELWIHKVYEPSEDMKYIEKYIDNKIEEKFNVE
jgi:16S rRNA G1207 methylase RsmC